MNIIRELDKISQQLNYLGLRLLVPSLCDQKVKEAHAMVVELGCKVDDLINDLMEGGDYDDGKAN